MKKLKIKSLMSMNQQNLNHKVNNMDFKQYQERAMGTAIYPGKGTMIGLVYVSLGLGEVGEVQGKVKKIIRDDSGLVTEEKRDAISKELGDVLWYVAGMCHELGLDMEKIAQANIDKLEDRQRRNVLKGSGDNR